MKQEQFQRGIYNIPVNATILTFDNEKLYIDISIYIYIYIYTHEQDSNRRWLQVRDRVIWDRCLNHSATEAPNIILNLATGATSILNCYKTQELSIGMIHFLLFVRPAQEFFTYMGTSPLPVKGCKI
jgi:hypothetical protein